MTCENALDMIDSYVDGDLGNMEQTALESHIVSCSVCAAELELARRVNAGIDSLALHKCPPAVIDAALAHAAAHPLPRFRQPWWWLVWRPALAGAVAVVLLFATAYVGQNGKQTSPQYTRAELEQARAEAKWTLVFINQLTRKTAATLKHEVMKPHMTETLRRVIDPNSGTTPKENGHAS